MTNRLITGDIGGGNFVVRSSMPGFDVMTEPLNSRNISFDSRSSDIGTVVASGLIQCGAAPTPFPTMRYVPIVMINIWNGTQNYLYNVRNYIFVPGGVVANAWGQRWIPAVALVTTSSIQVIAYTNPIFNTLSVYNPTGAYFSYSVFAAES